MRTEPAIDVDCGRCDATFTLSTRNERLHRQRGTPHVCPLCRFPASVSGPSAEAIAKAKRWWLARFSLNELRSWPPL